VKFRVGDKVIVTAGKDKGKKSEIIATFPEKATVVVKDVNMYVRHIKPFNGQAGQKVRKERAISVANIAILNDKDQPDRVGYTVAKDGSKVRMFKKTGGVVPTQSADKKTK